LTNPFRAVKILKNTTEGDFKSVFGLLLSLAAILSILLLAALILCGKNVLQLQKA
jgi:hypothetical protein